MPQAVRLYRTPSAAKGLYGKKVVVKMALNVDKRRLLAAAPKPDPELPRYVAQQTEVADFLRTAKERGYEEDD